jgi:hypothetical protein
MDSAAGNQAFRVSLHVLGNELIHFFSKSYYVGRDIIYQHCPVNAGCVQIFQESIRRTTEFGDLLKVRPMFLHQFQRLRSEHVQRLDMNVAVGDHY